MSRFTLRNTSGGSSLRNTSGVQALRDVVATATTYSETLADTLVLVTGWADALAHAEGSVNQLIFSDSSGGGTAYAVATADVVVFTDANAATFGSGAGNTYTHVGADQLVLTDALGQSFNVVVIPLISARSSWGRSREWNAWVDVEAAGQVVASSATGDFLLLGGRLTEDLSRSIIADISLELGFPGDVSSPHSLVPVQIGDPLDPNSGSVMRAYGGPPGEEQLMGTFDLADASVRIGAGGATVNLVGHSMERLIQKAGFWRVQSFEAFTLSVSLIRQLIAEVRPSAMVWHGPVWSWTPPIAFKPGEDRLSRIVEVASAGGIEFTADRRGDYNMVAAPTAEAFGTATPDFDITDGINARVATLTDATRDFADDDTHNGVIVEGDSHSADNTAPIVAALWNSRPASPVYFDPVNPGASRVGPRPKYIRSELVTTLEGAVAMAQAELAKVLMVSDAVTATVPANAALTPGPYAQLRAAGLGVDAVYRIVRVVHDLGGGDVEVGLYRQEPV